jgi:ferritin-like protein
MSESIINESILGSIRKLLGPEDDYTHFDSDIVIHINSAINRLYQLGVESAKNFRVTSVDETWSDLFGSEESVIDMCKTLIYYKVKMGFDPPTNSIAADAFKSEIDKQEWLISVWVESNTED